MVRLLLCLTLLSVLAFCYGDINYDLWKQRYLKTYQDGAYIQYNDGNGAAVTVSEAHGYGMLAAVLKNDRPTFNKLLTYMGKFKTSKGLMQWQQSTQGSTLIKSGGDNSATDGDLDIAYALLLAKDKWNDVTYLNTAKTILNALYTSCINPQLKNVLLGDWVNQGDQKRWTAVRPADLMIGHFAKFATVDARWGAVKDTSIKYIQDLSAAKSTGLFSDFATYDQGKKTMVPVNGWFLEKNEDGAYNWNSCRVPWRLAAYYKDSKDERIGAVLKKMVKFFDTKDPIQAGYSLDGNSLAGYEANAFTAPVWAAYQATGLNPTRKAKLRQRIRELGSNYFSDAIALVTLLQLE